MKKEKRFSESSNRGTGNGRITYGPESPKNPQHGDEWIDMVELSDIPTSPTDTGTPGEIRANVNYLYVCYAANSWIRFVKDGTWS